MSIDHPGRAALEALIQQWRASAQSSLITYGGRDTYGYAAIYILCANALEDYLVGRGTSLEWATSLMQADVTPNPAVEAPPFIVSSERRPNPPPPDPNFYEIAEAMAYKSGTMGHDNYVSMIMDQLREVYQLGRGTPPPIPQEDLPEDAAKVLRENLWNLYGGTPPEGAQARLLTIAGLVNTYHNDGTTLSAAETLRAIADALGTPMEPEGAQAGGAVAQLVAEMRTYAATPPVYFTNVVACQIETWADQLAALVDRVPVLTEGEQP